MIVSRALLKTSKTSLDVRRPNSYKSIYNCDAVFPITVRKNDLSYLHLYFYDLISINDRILLPKK